MVTKNVWFGSADYQIRVRGALGAHWSDWFDGMAIKSEGAITTISGNVRDQSALYGLLNQIRDLGLPLISVERVGSKPKNK